MNKLTKINLDKINYQSLFRVWRYSSHKIGRWTKFFINTKLFIKLVFFKIKFLNQDQGQPKIVNSYVRQDYSDFIDKLTGNSSLGRCSIGYQFSLRHKLSYVLGVIHQIKLNRLDLHEALLLYFLVKNNDIFLKFIENESVLILFAEMQVFENYMAQIARHVGCYTIGLQHGFYSNDYDRPTVNSLNYKNVVVDKMLVWGLDTKELLSAHNPNLKVAIVGRPSTHFLSDHNCHLTAESPSSHVAILDGDEFSETNDKIIKIVKGFAKRDGVEFFLKCHPAYQLKSQSLEPAILKDINRLGKNPHFVGYRSSLLLELAADHFFCFVLNESPFLKSDEKSAYNSFCWKKLEEECISDYIAFTSIEAQNLVVKEITNHISSFHQSNPAD
jgi:hypothetical protein